MNLRITQRATALAAFIVVSSVTSGALAQTTTSDPHHPDAQLVQAMPPAQPGDAVGQGKSAQPSQPGMMSPGMMGQGMMGGMMQPGRMAGTFAMPKHGYMMKVMFAIADANGDGGISFEELMTMHKRIFDKVDANNDGKVTPEELQAFMSE